MEEKAKKDSRLFTQLLIATLFSIFLLAVFLSILIITGNLNMYHNILMFTLVSVIIILVLMMMAGMIVLFSNPNKKSSPLFLKCLKKSLAVFYPMIYVTGSLMGIEKDRIRGEFAQVNNYIVGKERIKVKANEILILSPHCIQKATCPHKITNDIYNCKMCGQCRVKELIELSTKYGTQFAIVTGGTLARSTIVKRKPKAIIAIACERDLASGIQDVKVIPILGVVNERPEGPCYNTMVNTAKVEEAILYFLEREE